MNYNLGFGQYQPGVNGSAQNPYLQQNVNTALSDISKQYQTTTAPAMASRMASMGAFGNTGLQQVAAEQDRQFGQTLGNTAAQMYGAAYNTDRANDLAYTNAQNANATQRYGYDQSRAASQYASDNSLKGSMYGADRGLEGTMYSADKSAAASMYGADRSAGASMYGSDNALKIAGMNNDTTRRGQDQSYTLGLGNLGVNQQRTANDYNLGLGNLGLGYQQASNNYDLGLRQNDLGYASLDANIADRNFNNQLAAGNFGLTAYQALNNNNAGSLNAATQIQNTPLSYYNQFTNIANGIGNGYSTTTNTGQNSTAANVMGGAMMGNTLAGNLGFGRPPVVDDGYSIGLGSAYGGSVNSDGYWTPYRAGM